jgi:pyrroloquinoline quinone biosynthesis protein B
MAGVRRRPGGSEDLAPVGAGTGVQTLLLTLTLTLSFALAACGAETRPDSGQPAQTGDGAAAGAAGGAEIGPDEPFVMVLGVGQDGGYPQAGMKDGAAWSALDRRRLPVSLAIVDPQSGERWMIEATPAFPEQLQLLDRIAPHDDIPGLAGILLTHAHVGHYTGLIHLGREIIGARGVPVYAMPQMGEFLRTNGPWDQLVRLENIELRPLADGVRTPLNSRIAVTPLRVPHRDEYSETVGFLIHGPDRAVFFLPDIDKWERWDAWGTRIEDVIATVDVAYLDATFFADGEIPGRAMAEIPHPFVAESLERFAVLPEEERAKIRFIHINRTNPVGWPETPERNEVEAAGFRVADQGERVGLGMGTGTGTGAGGG